MKRQVSIIRLLPFAALVALLSPAVHAGGFFGGPSDKVYMVTAGTLTVNIVQQQLNNPMDPFDDTLEPISMIEEQAFGTLGRGRVSITSKLRMGPPAPGGCPAEFPVKIGVADDTIVITLNTLSQLYGNTVTTICMNPANGEQFVSSTGTWSGGSRRYADVIGGDFFTRSYAKIVSSNGQFLVTDGMISGTLVRD